ncbi:tetratricopeptide repeat protein [Streptomyces sp. NPDC005728]|uniref:tetratricopeptide repeat protein n=1 Tax=Streptomyces sp. NPDC005728 TaxID=3157054 RepID=UPI0033EA17CB
MIPEQADCFQYRGAVEALDAAMEDGRTAVLCQVLSGTGGVGKTQLAAHYARRRWESAAVDLLVWVSAGTRDAIVSAYARAARLVTGSGGDDPEEDSRDFLAWLASTDRRWLVVLDDLADPGDLNGLWPPRHPTGRVVVTTRRRDEALSRGGRRLVPVGLFTPEEAAAYLTARLGPDRDEPAEHIRALAEDLGHLPLALAQAAAYMADRGLDCAAYRVRFADRRRSLADVLPETGALPDDQRRTVAVTWSLSIELADQLRPAGLARPLLQLASMLDSNGIPTAVLSSTPALEYLAAERTPGTSDSLAAQEAVDEEAAGDALHCLRRLNLIDLAADSPDPDVRVHSLIQRATRDQLAPAAVDQAAQVAADALLHVWPQVEQAMDSGVLRANTAALQTHAGPRLWQAGAHPLLFEAGLSLARTKLLVSAGSYWKQLHAAARQHLGADHPDTLTTRARIAQWRGAAGDRTGAVAALEDLFADRVRVLGPDHPDTLFTRANIAMWRDAAGDRAGSVQAWQDLLADRLRVLGPDHPDTLATRANVAAKRGAAGDRAGAVQALKDLLADRIRVLGPDHPDTLATRATLAHWQGEAGDRTGAVRALEDLLADRLRVLGPDHPDTLATRATLAHRRRLAGDQDGALRAWDDLIAERVRVLGPDHPDTLDTRATLAHWRSEARDHAGALRAWEDLLADRIRVQGPDHRATLTTRAHIAQVLAKDRDPAGALRAWEDVLTDRLRVLGRDHPDTLTARVNVAQMRRVVGDQAGALQALEDLLADRIRVQGDDHRATRATRAEVANLRRVLRDLAAADAAGPRVPEAGAGTAAPRVPKAGLPERGFLLRWRAADGTRKSMGPFPNRGTAQKAGTWARQGGGDCIEVVEADAPD